MSAGPALKRPAEAQSPAPPAIAPQRRRRPNAAMGFLRLQILPRLLLVLLLLAAWESMARLMATPLVPGLAEIRAAIAHLFADGLVWQHMPPTVLRVFAGLGIAALLSVPLGILMGLNRWLHNFVEPAVLIGLSMPGLAWALMTIVWFGASAAAPITAVVLAGAPVMVLNVYQGVRAISADLLEMAHVFRFSGWVRLRYVILPALTPFLLSGARLGLSLSWKVVVVSEIFGLSSGVGYQMSSAFSSFDIASMFAWTFTFTGFMMLLEYGLLSVIERRVTAWRRQAAI